MVPDIINLINGASGFYKNDVENNIKYIKMNLDYLYGGANNFSVYIQTQAYVAYSWYVFSVSDWRLSLQNVNNINPSWSYLIVKQYRTVFVPFPSYTYFKIPDIGPGITEDIRLFIYNTISIYEPFESVCSCDTDSVTKIGGALISKYNQRWNTVCDASGVTQTIAHTANGLWGTFRPKNCYYTLFVSPIDN